MEGGREDRQGGTLTGKESSLLGFSFFFLRRGQCTVKTPPHPSVFCKSVSTQKIPGTHFINCRHIFFFLAGFEDAS